ncbi:MAG TPA: OsmC family protein [bacterium]|nr:OsmC family protein [bacterium]HOL67329.1 OsmC family protein [bacterium]HPP11347.1 OsmC family protein [bacterium]
MPIKRVQVEVVQGEGFKTECRAGKHTLLIDQPAVMGGTDAGPTPLDYQLMALGGCLAAIARIMARQRNLTLRAVKVSLEADLNTDRLLGKPAADRVGFSAIKASVSLDADLSLEEKKAFLKEVEERCPVSDNLINPTPVTVVLAG